MGQEFTRYLSIDKPQLILCRRSLFVSAISEASIYEYLLSCNNRKNATFAQWKNQLSSIRRKTQIGYGFVMIAL